MDYIKLLQSAAKGKAPVVAIPVEGKAPFCVNRKRLATWLKGVTVVAVQPIQPEDEYYTELVAPKSHHSYYERDENGASVYRVPEGPHDIVLHTVTHDGTLKVTGRVHSKGFSHRSEFDIKTVCWIKVIDRRTAVKELSVWSSKERERIEKKVMLGALAKEDKKALKMAKHDTESDRMINVDCVINGQPGKVAKRGLPVSIPEYPRLRFALVMLAEGDWSVTELTTGKAAGANQTTAEAALVDARQRAKRMTTEKREELQDKVLTPPPDEMEVAAA